MFEKTNEQTELSDWLPQLGKIFIFYSPCSLSSYRTDVGTDHIVISNDGQTMIDVERFETEVFDRFYCQII